MVQNNLNKMKRLLVLAVLSVFTLSSFNSIKSTENVLIEKSTKMRHYTYKCKNGNYGSFSCDCDLAGAWNVANALCSL